MDCSPIAICKLCLNVVSGEDFKTIDEAIREVLLNLLKVSVNENAKSVVCTTCAAKLSAAFQFKRACLDTEDRIFPYVNAENAPVDLKDVYLKEKGEEKIRSMSEDDKICRLCLQVVATEFTSVEDVESDVIQKFIPELNFSSTNEPVICTACLGSLNTHSSFLRNCLDVQEHVENFRCNKDDVFCIEERFEIKREEIECDGDNDGRRDDFFQSRVKVDNTEFSLSDNATMLSGFETASHKIPNVHEWDPYNYQTDQKDHLQHHTNNFETNTFKHEAYDFEAQKKYKPEPLEGVSETTVLKNDTPDKTKRKGNFETHKDSPATKTFKCTMCDFKTNGKKNFRQHQVVHKDLSEVKVFKCETCDFKTKYKNNLKTHVKSHKDAPAIEPFKCDACDYETIHKNRLKRHQLTHKDISEIELFECEICGFKTKLKGNLKQHRLRHVDIQETAFELETSDIGSSKTKVFQCGTCDFKSKYKSALTQHCLRHKDASEIELFKCDTCSFKSKYRRSLQNHYLIHKKYPK